MSLSNQKKPTSRTSSLSSRDSIAKSVSSRHGSSASSSMSTKSRIEGALDWQAAQERNCQLESLTCDSSLIRDLHLRLMRPDEALVAIRRQPARRSSRSSQGLPRYITDKQPAIATKLVIEFVVCGPKPATCKVALSKCLSGESACRGTGAELKRFTTLIRVFHKDPTIPLIRLPACINLNKVVFEPGNVNNWASSAQISIDEEQGAKFSVNIHGQDYDVSRRRAIYPDFLRTSKRKAWSKWLGPLAFADQDKPFTFYHPNIKVVDIKRNVVGEIVSCRLQQVTDSAPAIRRGTADLV